MSNPADVSWRKVHRRMNEHLLFFEDLEGRTSIDLEVVDSGITEVKDADGNKDMPWIAFRGAKKRFALNRTNCKTLESICGTDVISQWRGWITLTVVMTEYQDKKTRKREKTKALRIAPTRPDRAKSGQADKSSTSHPPSTEPISDEEAAAIQASEDES